MNNLNDAQSLECMNMNTNTIDWRHLKTKKNETIESRLGLLRLFRKNLPLAIRQHHNNETRMRKRHPWRQYTEYPEIERRTLMILVKQ